MKLDQPIKLTLDLTPCSDGTFETKRTWEGLNEETTPIFYQRLCQLIEHNLWQTVNQFTKTIAEGSGPTEEKARERLNIDEDIRRAGGEFNAK